MGFENIVGSFLDIFIQPTTLLYGGAAMLLGILFGALPGLTAALGVALLVGFAFLLPTEQMLVILLCIYVGGIYGGSLSAILMNIPGTGAAIATSWDGNPLARRGEAGLAIGTAATASFIGTVFGLLVLAVATPLLSTVALQITSPEVALLAILGVLLVGSLNVPDTPLKGWLAGLVGLLLATVGLDAIDSSARFTFGMVELTGGIAFIPAMIGLFGIAQIIDTLVTGSVGRPETLSRILPNVRTLVKYLPTTIRSALIGVGVGATPGVGENISSILSYSVAKQVSKEKERFGEGSYEGIIASETANNSCVPATTIPLLTLGIPGSPVTAIILGALILQGIEPGPLLLVEQPELLWDFVAIFLLAAVLLIILALLLARPLSKIMEINPLILLPVITAVCVIGAYTLNLSRFDVYVMLAFGLIGYLMRLGKYPAAPLVLGLILGPYIETNLRRTLLLSEGSLEPFVTRPISIVFVLAIVLLLTSQTRVFGSVMARIRRGFRRDQT